MKHEQHYSCGGCKVIPENRNFRKAMCHMKICPAGIEVEYTNTFIPLKPCPKPTTDIAVSVLIQERRTLDRLLGNPTPEEIKERLRPTDWREVRKRRMKQTIWGGRW